MSSSAVKRGVPGTVTGVVIVVVVLLAASYYLASAWRIEVLRTDPYAVHVVARVTWIQPVRYGGASGWGSYSVLGRVEDNVPLGVGQVPVGTPVSGLVDPADPRFFLRDGTDAYVDLIVGLLGVGVALLAGWWVYRWRRAWTSGDPLPTLRYGWFARRPRTIP